MSNLTVKQNEDGKYGFVDDAVRLTKASGMNHTASVTSMKTQSAMLSKVSVESPPTC